MKSLHKIPIELIFWMVSLGSLATMSPRCLNGHSHFTLCPLANLGCSWCPGCGLGRAITELFHGHFGESMQLHWFGMPAVVILCWRMVTLIKFERNRMFNLKNNKNYV